MHSITYRTKSMEATMVPWHASAALLLQDFLIT